MARSSGRVGAYARVRATWLSKPWVVGLALSCAVLLTLPSLSAGLQTEDYHHRALSRSTDALVNLFGQPGSPTWANYLAKDHGTLPWVAVEDLHVALWRPLASATHHLDYRLWPDAPSLMHLHSVLWLGALVVAVGLLFRRLQGTPWAAGVAVLLYAVDDAHGPAVGWLANRNALMATTFGVLALVAHDRWRRGGWRPGVAVAPACLWLGLMSGELAVGAIGYFVAYTLLVDGGRWRSRLTGTLPWGLAALSWALTYRLLGYGAQGSGAYVDPLRQPTEFASVALERLPLLFGGQMTGLPIGGFIGAAERWPTTTHAVVTAVLASSIAALWPLLRHRRRARFWALGALLSALPACGTYPADRLLFFVSLGATALIADVIEGVAHRRRDVGLSWVRPAAAWWIVGCGVISASILPARSLGLRAFDDWVLALGDTAFRDVDPDVRDLVLVNAPDLYTTTSMVTVENALRPTRHRTRVLYGGYDPLDVHRASEETLVLSTPAGFLGSPMNRIFRGVSYPLRPGDGLQLTGVLLLVEETDASGAPTRVRARFAEPLESRRFDFRYWDGASFRAFPIPDVGTSTRVGPGIALGPANSRGVATLLHRDSESTAGGRRL